MSIYPQLVVKAEPEMKAQCSTQQIFIAFLLLWQQFYGEICCQNMLCPILLNEIPPCHIISNLQCKNTWSLLYCCILCSSVLSQWPTRTYLCLLVSYWLRESWVSCPRATSSGVGMSWKTTLCPSGLVFIDAVMELLFALETYTKYQHLSYYSYTSTIAAQNIGV